MSLIKWAKEKTRPVGEKYAKNSAPPLPSAGERRVPLRDQVKKANAKTYVVTDGKNAIVSVHPTKKEAHEVGNAMRKEGKDAFAHSAANYEQFHNPGGLAKWAADKAASGGKVDDYIRDELGRFASK